MSATIMLLGLGDLGSVILELLGREADIDRIIAGSRDAKRGLARCNLARMSAMAQGYNPKIDFVQLDLNHKEAVAATIHRESPDLILCTATMLTWWLPDLLPPEPAAALRKAGFGVWLPVHLSLTMKLMQAVRDAHYAGLVLTAPFPDVVNCVLGRLDLAPACGIGNLDEIVPKVRLLAAEKLHTSLEALQVWLVAHHALERFAFADTALPAPSEIPPFFLRIEHNGQDVTKAIQAESLLLAPYPLTSGRASHFLTAGSTIRLLRSLLSENDTLLHAPAPNGLPGGYPLIASAAGVRPAPIPGLSLPEAIAINENSHRFDGIERIEADGTVVFSPAAVAVMRETIGYECHKLTPNEAESRALELKSRFQEYAARSGVRI